MGEAGVELLDLHSEVKCGIFGLCCVATLLAFAHVLYRFALSPSRIPRSELYVVLLSCAQLLFGVFFYFGSQHPFLQILNKAIKVAQSEIISWSCLVIMLVNKPARSRLAAGCFHVFNAVMLCVLVYSFLEVDVSTIYVNAKVGIFMSSLWFAVSLAVLYVAQRIRRRLDVRALLRLEEKPRLAGGGERPADADLAGPDAAAGRIGSSDFVESYSDTKYQQFLLLVVVEAVTALGTLIWDVILYYSIHRSLRGNRLEINMPVLKEFLYVASNTILILIPNWTVFYVFYWVQRRNYNRLSASWDVNLNAMRFEVKGPVEAV